MAEPVDPLLPSRLRRNEFIRNNEAAVGRAWFSSAQTWLDFIRPTVMAPFRESNGTLPPDPRLAASTASQANWEGLLDSRVMPTISSAAQGPWEGSVSAGPPGLEETFDTDPTITAYLIGSRNRLKNFPTEVYALVQRIVANGIRDGLSIPGIAEQVGLLLTATGTDRWPNRATTVARTETIGAVNAGAFAGAKAMAQETGDPNPEKVWLATDDTRTRPTHNEAEGQRVPLNEPFIVGGFPLNFPGDPSGPPQEVISCRCSFLHVVQGETIDWTDRQFRQDAEDVWEGFDLQSELEG